jgi:acetyl-CoA C-acetyltransferase
VFARTYFLQGLDQGFLFILRQKRGNVSAVPSPKPITILAHLFFGLIIRQNFEASIAWRYFLKEIVLISPVRTAIGKFGGALSSIPAQQLGSIVITEALHRAGVPGTVVDQVLMGCVLQAGLGQNPARQAALQAELPIEIPASTINCVCGSGLQAINLAASLIRAGEADLIVAGGMENMSRAPYLLPNARFGYRINDGALQDEMLLDGLQDAYGHYPMGMTAELVAEKYVISRAEQDAFAAASQQRCAVAWQQNRFADEIVPVTVKMKKETVEFAHDEFPRAGVTAASLAALPPVFKPEGTVTAGNSSGINDGAAAMIVTTAEKAHSLGVTPFARWVAAAETGVDPAYMGIGPVSATRKTLQKAGLSLAQVDLIEANEAFAAQSIAVIRELGLDPQKVNVNGGAIALGHPIGASGARILVTLLHEMKRRASRYGLATLCIGGGMGISTIVGKIE